jgi:cell division protein FtsB
MVTKDSKIKKGLGGDKFLPILLACLVFIIVGFLVYSDMKISSRRTELSVQLRALQEQLAELEAKRLELEAQVSQGESEAYLEQEARETFNLKKPGEEVVTVLPPEDQPAQEPAKGFLERVIDKIKFW